MSPKIKIPLFLAALALLWWGAVNLAFERGVRTGMNQELPTFHEQRLQVHAFHLEQLAEERFSSIELMAAASIVTALVQINERDLGNPKKSDFASPITRRVAELESSDDLRPDFGGLLGPEGMEMLRQELALFHKENNS